MGLTNVKIAKVAVAYDCLLRHETYILIFDQVLYIPNQDVNLLCVDQMREHGVLVNDVPLQRLKPQDRTPDSHSLLDEASGLQVILRFHKPVSYFSCRKPSQEECYDDLNNTHVVMTSAIPWIPYDPDAEHLEDRLRQSVQGDTALHRRRASALSK